MYGVEQLLNPVQHRIIGRDESLNTSTASDYSKKCPPTGSSSSSDSPRPPDGVMDIPEEGEGDSNNHVTSGRTNHQRRKRTRIYATSR